MGERGPRAQGGAHLPRADLPQPRGPAHPQLAAQDRLSPCATDACDVYEREVIPFWRGRSHARPHLRRAAAGVAGGLRGGHVHRVHGAARARPHRAGRQDLPPGACSTSRRDIAAAMAALDFSHDPEACDQREQLSAMDIACDAVILFAERHADAGRRAGRGRDRTRDAGARAASRSPTSAAACRPTRRATSRRRCRRTGSATWP